MAERIRFADRLRQLREAAGLSQYRLAQLAGLNKQTLSRLEKTDSDPTWTTVVKLAHALGVAITEFDFDPFADTSGSEPPETPPYPASKRK